MLNNKHTVLNHVSSDHACGGINKKQEQRNNAGYLLSVLRSLPGVEAEIVT